MILMHPDDLAARYLKHGNGIDVEAVDAKTEGSTPLAVRGYTAVAYEIARGSDCPEGNAMVALGNHGARSGTPAKSVPVRIVATTATEVAA